MSPTGTFARVAVPDARLRNALNTLTDTHHEFTVEDDDLYRECTMELTVHKHTGRLVLTYADIDEVIKWPVATGTERLITRREMLSGPRGRRETAADAVVNAVSTLVEISEERWLIAQERETHEQVMKTITVLDVWEDRVPSFTPEAAYLWADLVTCARCGMTFMTAWTGQDCRWCHQPILAAAGPPNPAVNHRGEVVDVELDFTTASP